MVTDDTGAVLAHVLPNGMQATSDDLQLDAQTWAAHFGRDAFDNHCSNHEHDCTETCIKYVKKKLEAKESLRSNKVPSCRFWFFRIKKLNLTGQCKAVRRRGKPLVAEPFIEESDDRNQQCRCQVKRLQPFRSASNDVAQVTSRCNVDYQFLACAPAAVSTGDAPQLAISNALATASTSDAAQFAISNTNVSQSFDSSQLQKRRRLTKKTNVLIKQSAQKQKTKTTRKWFYRGGALHAGEQATMESFAAAFQKAYAMDFYITKYQGKMMEALTP